MAHTVSQCSLWEEERSWICSWFHKAFQNSGWMRVKRWICTCNHSITAKSTTLGSMGNKKNTLVQGETRQVLRIKHLPKVRPSMWKPNPAQETLMELEPVWEWERTRGRFLQSSSGMFFQAVLETGDQATWTLCLPWHGNFYLPRMKLCIFLPNIYTICMWTTMLLQNTGLWPDSGKSFVCIADG